jgi:tRNA(fMet)-specific endonuclease VapC
MTYLVDSDYVADYLKGRMPATTLLDHLFSEGLAISIVTFAEVYEGIHYGHQQSHYKAVFRRFLAGVSVLGINRSTARLFAVIRGELRRKGQLIPHPDLFIAATAIHHNLTLVTHNIRDYDRIPNLKLYHPTS